MAMNGIWIRNSGASSHHPAQTITQGQQRGVLRPAQEQAELVAAGLCFDDRAKDRAAAIVRVTVSLEMVE